MDTITITKENALKAFKASDKTGKQLLSNLLGEKTFNEKVTDRIKTLEDAFSELDIDSDILDDYPEDVRNFKKLTIITQALNEGWTPDWKDGNQRKWYPWFEYGSSGFGFSASGYAGSLSDTRIGSRLCFKSEELATYSGKQFLSLYNEYLLETNP